MTLVEVMVATGVGSIVLVAVMALSLFSARTFAALKRLSPMTATTSTSLTFRTMDPDTGVTNTLAYNYDSSRTTLTRTLAGQSTVLLTNCTFLQFSIFKRNPEGGTYDQYPVDDPGRPDLCKLVQLTWVCSRNVLGRFANTESVQSAKIVMRKP